MQLLVLLTFHSVKSNGIWTHTLVNLLPLNSFFFDLTGDFCRKKRWQLLEPLSSTWSYRLQATKNNFFSGPTKMWKKFHFPWTNSHLAPNIASTSKASRSTTTNEYRRRRRRSTSSPITRDASTSSRFPNTKKSPSQFCSMAPTVWRNTRCCFAIFRQIVLVIIGRSSTLEMSPLKVAKPSICLILKLLGQMCFGQAFVLRRGLDTSRK